MSTKSDGATAALSAAVADPTGVAAVGGIASAAVALGAVTGAGGGSVLVEGGAAASATATLGALLEPSVAIADFSTGTEICGGIVSLGREMSVGACVAGEDVSSR